MNIPSPQSSMFGCITFFFQVFKLKTLSFCNQNRSIFLTGCPCCSLCLVSGIIVFLFFVIMPPGAYSQVVINEVQSSNNETIADEGGDYEDWIELYNTGSETVQIGHYALSDDYDDPYQWLLPAGTAIAPGEFLLVWASGKDRTSSGEPLHTNFRISTEGEEIILTDVTDGSTVDELPPTPIPSDHSYGRYPDGTDNWYLFSDPTPGAPNQDTGYEGIADKPVFDWDSGFYTEPFDLKITSGHPDDVIYYTTDGSMPTTDSYIYSRPIAITRRDSDSNVFSTIRTSPDGTWSAPSSSVFKGHVIRATAIRDGQRKSEVASGSWFIHPQGAERYSFPVISILSDPEGLFSDETGIMVPGDAPTGGNWRTSQSNYYQRGREWERPAHMTFFERDGVVSPEYWNGSMETSPGPLEKGFEQNIGLRIHGGYTRRYPQKSFRIYARSDYDWESDITYPLIPGNKVPGTDEPQNTYKRFILRSSGDDQYHTMFKDAMIQSLYSDRLPDQQAYRPAIVFINGDYWGIHNLRERYGGWYVETNYGIHRDDVALLSSSYIGIEIGEGTEADRDQYTDILDYARNYNLASQEHYDYIGTKIDIENFLQYKTFKVYAANADWPHNNIRYWRKRTDEYLPDAPYGADGRWRWMIFDLDASFGYPYGNGIWAQYDMDMIEWITGYGNERLSEGWVNDLFNGLIENESFRNRFINKLADDLNTRYDPGFVTDRIYDFMDFYDPEIEEHIARYSSSAGGSRTAWVNTHINRMVEFADNRPGYMREHLMDHFYISGTSRLDLEVTDQEKGYIRVNELDIHPDTPGVPEDISEWNGIYFNGISVKLTPVPKEGYVFLEWRDGDGNPIDFEESPKLTVIDSDEGVIKWNPDGRFSVVAVFATGEPANNDDNDLPEGYFLGQNYPNPFNNQTIIPYHLDKRATVTFKLFTIEGRMIRSLQNGVVDPGSHKLHLQTTGLASGLYLYRMQAVPETGSSVTTASRKMILIR